MKNFKNMSSEELANTLGGRKKGGFGTWWHNFQKGTGRFLTGLRDGLAGR